MSHPDSHFRDKLYDLETPLGSRMSFDEVMRRRKSARKLLWWKPVVIVLAGLFTIAGSAYFYMGDDAGKQNGTAVQSQKVNENAGINDKFSERNANKSAADNAASNNEPIAQTGTQPEQKWTLDAQANTGSSHNLNTELLNRKTGEILVTAAGGEKSDAVSGQIVLNAAADVKLVERSVFARMRSLINFYKKSADLKAPEWKEIESLMRLHYMPQRSILPDFIEFSMVTGGNGYRNFDEKADFSVRGNHQFSQYRAVALYSLPGDLMLGAGVISEWGMGAAQVRRMENIQRMVIDSHTLVIIQPGLPPKNVVVKDTSFVNERVAKGSEVSYRLSKYAVPIALRYMIQTGKGSLRLGMDIAPGIMASQSGTLFSKNSILAAEQLPDRAFTLDLKLSAGIQFALSAKTSVIAEPVFNMQSVRGGQWKQFNRAGLGFGLGFVYRL